VAKAAGADDAWLVEDGKVTEGTSNNAYIVKGGRIITRELSNDILHGITRAAVLRFAREAQMEVEERPFTIEEAQGADEAFITSARSPGRWRRGCARSIWRKAGRRRSEFLPARLQPSSLPTFSAKAFLKAACFSGLASVWYFAFHSS